MKHHCGQRKAASRSAAFCKIMKSKLISIIFTAAVLSLVESCFAQGFTNLDFEHAKIAAGPGGFGILTSNAIPGWTAYIGGTPQSVIFNDRVPLGGAMVSLQDTNARSEEHTSELQLPC